MDGISLVQFIGVALSGWVAFGSLAAWVARAIATDRWRPGAAADRELAVMQKQRDDAVAALRESHEVGRINAESIRDLTGGIDRLADGQDVIATVIKAGLPSLRRSEQ